MINNENLAEEIASPPLLQVENLCKNFPGVQALKNVSLELHQAEVLAVIGENGAGKSTLMKILAGIQAANSGSIFLNGIPVQFKSVEQALHSGIVLIHQELNLAENLTVGANLFLGREPTRWGFIDEAKIEHDSKEALKRVGLTCSPKTPLVNLSIAKRQLVEIAKAISIDARILIMDEPTSSLSQHETEILYRVVEELKSQGVSIVYISHRLNEVQQLADRVVILRDGENAGELSKENINRDQMVSKMVGRKMTNLFSRNPHQRGKLRLELQNIKTPEFPEHSINFSIHAGEIVGIAGLIGAGRTELLNILFGVNQPLYGTIKVDGQTQKFNSPTDAINAGIALVPEDRKTHGLLLEMSVMKNLSLPSLKKKCQEGLFLNQNLERKITDAAVKTLQIKIASSSQKVESLSGGNQQKIVLAKWLETSPKVLILDEPTRGVDVGAKEEIYKLIDQLAAEGIAILFASSEMDEIQTLADRVFVMHEGRLAGELSKNKLTEMNIMQLATGGSLNPLPEKCTT